MTWQYLVAALADTVGGWLFTGGFLWLIRGSLVQGSVEEKKQSREEQRGSFQIFDLYLGGTERIIATLLFVVAPAYLGPFVGGWIAIKFAASWKRHENTLVVRYGSLLFLIGNAVSFAIAIACGYWLKPDHLAFFAK